CGRTVSMAPSRTPASPVRPVVAGPVAAWYLIGPQVYPAPRPAGTRLVAAREFRTGVPSCPPQPRPHGRRDAAPAIPGEAAASAGYNRHFAESSSCLPLPVQKPSPRTAPAQPPLAHLLRPQTLDEYLGQEHLLGP